MRKRIQQRLRSMFDKLERSGTPSVSKVVHKVADRVRALRQFVPKRLIAANGEQEKGDLLTPAELSKLYSALPPEEKRLLSESARVAASDALTTAEGLAPRGENLTHRAYGQLLFEDDGPDGKPRPLHNVLVELWDRDYGFDDILGRGMTDKNGEFEIWYDPDDAGKYDAADLDLRVFETNYIYKKGTIQLTQTLVYTINGDKDVTAQSYDFGDQRVPYWEYDETRVMPRLMVVDYSSPPQAFSPGRALMMNKQLKWLVAIKESHLAINLTNPFLPSLDDIQKDYPENLTLILESSQQADTRGDEFFGERLLNGMGAAVLDKDPRDPSRFWIHHHWNSYEQNGEYAAPNVDIYLKIIEGKLKPVEIELEFRNAGDKQADAPLNPKQSFTPDGDPEKWLQAKRLARASAALHAELDVHLAQTHLNIEQYAVAAYRSLRRSPLRQLLFPHVKEVVLINRDADIRLLGRDGFIPRAQALTARELERRLVQVLGTLDWRDWQPRPVYCEAHTYGKAAALFWEMLTGYIDNFFEDHQEEIPDTWYEVHRFSRDLLDHSVPMFLCTELRGRLLDKDGQVRDDSDWYEPNERMNLALEREEIHGVAKALSAVTKTDHPQPQDIANMKQLCRYVIFHSTFFHHWVNSHQYDDGGEIRYSGLGLRWGHNGPLAPESDDSVAPPPDVATEQLWFANVLTNTRFGLIMSNEDRDIDPKLIEALRQRRKSFEAVDVDIYQLSSRPSI